MKKYIIPMLAAFVLLTTGNAFAQPLQDDHELRITIPDLLMIRVVSADANPAAVVFDYAANQAAYLSAIEAAGGTWLAPTSHNLSAVEVLAVGQTWRVTVSTSGPLTNTGIGLDRVRVTRASSAGQFLLDSTANIATGGPAVWASLGISGASYAVFVDGTESDGDDTIDVFYTIHNP